MIHDRHSALAFARRAHANQIGDDGRPHYEHVERVVANVERLLASLPEGTLTELEVDETLQAAALHDCPEDSEHTGVTHEDLEAEGFAPDVRRTVRRLDKRFKVGTYQEDKEAIVEEGDIRVLVCKLADTLDNGSPERLATLPPEKRSIGRRYARSGAVLQAGFDAFRDAAMSRPPLSLR